MVILFYFILLINFRINMIVVEKIIKCNSLTCSNWLWIHIDHEIGKNILTLISHIIKSKFEINLKFHTGQSKQLIRANVALRLFWIS